jgi:hypothetical protein
MTSTVEWRERRSFTTGVGDLEEGFGAVGVAEIVDRFPRGDVLVFPDSYQTEINHKAD